MAGAGVTEARDGAPRDRLPAWLTPPFLRSVGLVALVALAGEVLLMPRLAALDGVLWRWILYARHCATDRAVDAIVEITTRLAIVLLTAAALLRARQDGVRAVWPPLAVCLVGLQAGKLLKNVFARERPSMLPGSIIGHSFPSGHVMNTALAALAVVVLAAAFRHPRRWRTAALATVTIVFFGRLLLAHHWLLDAIGGLLAALALNGLALPVVRSRPLLAPAALLAGLTAVLMIALHAQARLYLPSPLSVAEYDGVELRVGESSATEALSGAWIRPAERFRRGTFLWFDGVGIATLTVRPPSAAGPRDDGQRVPRGSEATLAFGGRPDLRERRCLTMRVSVNGRELPPFVPFVGWREYRLLLPPDTLRVGPNEVRLQVLDANGGAWRYAVAYIRLDLD